MRNDKNFKELLWDTTMSLPETTYGLSEALDAVVSEAQQQLESFEAFDLPTQRSSHQFKRSNQKHFIPITGKGIGNLDLSQFENPHDVKKSNRRKWVKRAAVAGGVLGAGYLVGRKFGPYQAKIHDIEQKIVKAWNALKGAPVPEDLMKQNYKFSQLRNLVSQQDEPVAKLFAAISGDMKGEGFKDFNALDGKKKKLLGEIARKAGFTGAMDMLHQLGKGRSIGG